MYKKNELNVKNDWSPPLKSTVCKQCSLQTVVTFNGSLWNNCIFAPYTYIPVH